MTALIEAELLKLRSTRTFAAIAGTAAALSLVLTALAAGVGGHHDPRALLTRTSIAYFVIIVLLGAIGTTGEWRHRTITSTVLAAPDRLRLLAAKALSYSLAGIVLSLLVTVVTMLIGMLILDGRGQATLGVGGLADVLWRNLAIAAVLAPLGVGVGALLRNQTVTVIASLVVAAVLEPALLNAVPHVGRFGPMIGAPTGILGGADAAANGPLALGLALGVLLAWAAVAFAAAAARLRRRDLL